MRKWSMEGVKADLSRHDFILISSWPNTISIISSLLVIEWMLMLLHLNCLSIQEKRLILFQTPPRPLYAQHLSLTTKHFRFHIKASLWPNFPHCVFSLIRSNNSWSTERVRFHKNLSSATTANNWLVPSLSHQVWGLLSWVSSSGARIRSEAGIVFYLWVNPCRTHLSLRA